MDGYKHKHNTNVLVIGGSGAGKTRTYAVPNVLQAGCSMVITDPKAEILRKTGAFLLAQGYEVRVFDLIDPSASFCYNPFCYVQSDKDVLQLIADLIQNTTPPNAHENDPFWSKAETALLQALMLYLIHEAPADEQNFAMVMEMIAAAEVREDDADYQSPLDILFERLEMREPDSIACKQYRIFKQAAGKTARSILVSVGVRLAAFNLPQIARLTMADELHLEELGERKIALFCCIPDSDKSLNYLVGMIYSQLIQTLYRQADRVHRGRLPVPVHLLIDEFPNISLPKDSFLSALATMRSRGIFCSIIAQNMQRIECRKFAEQQGWNIIKELCEKGVSGFKISADDRDAIQELREDAMNQRFDVLLVFMFDRLGRRDDETPFVVEWFAKQGIRIFSVKEGEQKFESHTDSLINYIRYWQSEGESRKTSMRIKTRLDQMRGEGLYTGGTPRYGYRAVEKGRRNKKDKPVKDLEICPEEAAVVKEIFERTVYEGAGSFILATELSARGVRTIMGHNSMSPP